MQRLSYAGSNIIKRLTEIRPLALLSLSVIISFILAETIVMPLSIFFHGKVTYDYLISAMVTSLIVSIIVCYFLIYLSSQLREITERFRGSFETSAVGIGLLSLDGHWLRVNPALCAIVGYSEHELLTMTFQHITHPEDLEIDLAFVKSLLAGAIPYHHMEKRCYHKEGQIVWIFLSVSLVRDVKSSPLYFVAQIQDITERKQYEKTLKKNEENFRNLIDRNPVAIAVLDKSGKFIFLNNKFTETFGYTMQDIPTIDDWWPLAYPDEEYRQKVINGWRTAAKKVIRDEREKQAQEWRVTCKDGSYRDIEFRMSSLEDINIIIFHDITGRKKAEEEHGKLQAQLLQSHKMEAVGRLAGGIAHDFNNLMTAVIGYSDLILSELPEKHFARDKIKIVRDTGDKASDLVRQILAFSRNQLLEMNPVNLNETVWNMNKIFGRTIGEDIELELDISKTVKNVLADAGQIEQVLMNLVVNARDAMPNGGRLIIETDSAYLDETYSLIHNQLITPGPYAMLSVTDNGTGMGHEIKEKIFEPFFTTKGTGKGTGLGLSTTYGIIKQHNGYIWVYSKPGQGTTFKVYLPAIEEEVKEVKKHEPSITGDGTETILVVDDEPLVRQFVMDVLQPRGYKLYEADGAAKALKITEQIEGKIDLLLTDLVMPGIKGSELRKLFIERWPGIKVCIMSGYGDKNIFSGGMEDITFIQKPLTPRKLTTKLRNVLDYKLD